ncbi:acetamidase/formamidase family protein [Rhodovulum sp.]
MAEITFCGAIEMAGWLHIKVDLIKGWRGEIRDQEPDLQTFAHHAEI